MKKWKDKIEKVFAAAAFAEAGEHETALEMAGPDPILKRKMLNFFKSMENVFTAVTYAEADCHEMAREYMAPHTFKAKTGSLTSFLETVGLQGVRVCMITARI